MGDALMCVLCRARPVDSRWRPFCSERCRNEDLARWAEGQYHVAAEPVLEGDIARCYSHTPTGALLAAVQIEYRIALARDGVGVAREQTVPGEGQDRLVAALEQRGWEPPTPGEICQVAGFRIVTYTEDDAVVSLASRCASSGSLQLTEARMQWTGGDWRRVLAPDGSLSPTASALSDLGGMVEWGGV